MHQSLVLVATTLSSLCTAALSPNTTFVLHEERDTRNGWIVGKHPSPHAIIPLRIALTQRNLDKGYDFLMNVSDPKSPSYGKHWTPQQVTSTFAPSPASIEAVRLWLEDYGFPSERVDVSFSKSWITISATVQEAEDLLRTQFNEYVPGWSKNKNQTYGRGPIACDRYYVPEQVRDHIDFIYPGVQFSRVPQQRPRKPNSTPHIKGPAYSLPVEPKDMNMTNCDQYATPDCVAALYGVDHGDKNDVNNSLGIREYEGDVYAAEDLDFFFGNFSTKVPKGTRPKLVSIDGAKAPTTISRSGLESMLDFELVYPLIWPQGTTLYQAVDYPAASKTDPFLDVIDNFYSPKILNKRDPDPETGKEMGAPLTNIVSISYGTHELSPTKRWQERRCQEYMKLGLMGHTVVQASGDTGVAARPGETGYSNGCFGQNGDIFAPSEGVNCPYVTAVGATLIVPGESVNQPETASQFFGSGGGFSNMFLQPNYQAQAVKNYLDKAPMPGSSYSFDPSTTNNLTLPMMDKIANGSLFNRIGRAYPDVSAIGENIVVMVNGQLQTAAGTSASAPVFAALLNRVNEERLAIGKGRVGFVNPVLYAHPEVLRDVATGDTGRGCKSNGFETGKGWDPVTGLGTPDYKKMVELWKYVLP